MTDRDVEWWRWKLRQLAPHRTEAELAEVRRRAQLEEPAPAAKPARKKRAPKKRGR